MTDVRRQRASIAWWGLLFLLLALPATREAGSNAMVRFATTVRIVEAHTLELGEYGGMTNDVAVTGGRAYLDKAPAPSFALVPFYAVVRFVTSDFNLARHLTRLLSLALLTLLAAAMLRRRLPAWGVDGLLRDVTVTTYVVGTFGWAYFVMLYSHGFVADAILIAVLLLTDYRRVPDRPRALYLSGLCFGLAIASEYPAALLGLSAGLYLLTFERRPLRVLAFAALGVLLPAAIVAGFNTAAFGHPLHFGYQFESDHYYLTSMQNGFMGAGWPNLANLYLLFLSPNKGMFFWSPVILFGVVGAVVMLRRQPREGGLIAAMLLLYALFFGGYFEASGGACLGPRHLAPLLGPLLLAAAWWVARRGRLAASLFAGAAVVSSLLAWLGVFTEPQMPDRLLDPLWEFALPMLREGIGAGNLLSFPDPVAAAAGAALLAAVWFLVFVDNRPRTGIMQTQSGFATVLVILVLTAFYVGVLPRVVRTEPGIVHQVIGNHFMVRRDYRRAAWEYGMAWQTRKDPWILFYQAKAYLQLGDDDLAGRALQLLMTVDPTILGRGRTHDAQPETEGAPAP